MNKILIVIFSLFILTSCNKSDKNSIDVVNAKKYLNNELGLKIPIKHLYIILPTDGCSTCVNLTIKEILSYKKKKNLNNITVVFIGTTKKELQFFGKKIEKDLEVVYDYRKKITKKSYVLKLNSMVILDIDSYESEILFYSMNKNFDLMPSVIRNFLMN